RSAAWFALGRVKATRRPVALLCTSGTAVANWLPAVIEADLGALPLLLLSADRPPELHGWGANQTIAQAGLFAGQVRAAHDPGAPFPGFSPDWLRQLAARAVADSRWPLPGPVHLNLPLREPLLPAAPASVEVHFPPSRTGFQPGFLPDLQPDLQPESWPGFQPIACARPELRPEAGAVRALAQTLAAGRGAIVCAEGCAGTGDPAAFADAVSRLAERLGCPILAEPLSGLRFGAHDRTHICHRHDLWLRDEGRRQTLRPDWVLRFGAYPVTRTLQGFVASAATLLVEAHGRWPDPAHATRVLLRADPLATCQALLGEDLVAADPAWLATFRAAEAAAESWLEKTPQPAEARLLAALCAALPAGTQVFCGNSLPIRDLSAHSGSGEKPLAFFANRGASGIDGNLATAAGLAGGAWTKGSRTDATNTGGKTNAAGVTNAPRETGTAGETGAAGTKESTAAARPTLAVVGDLTAQHDLGSLALVAGRPLVVVLIDNGGGGIFDLLPPAGLPEFEAGWLTPQHIDFAHAAAAFGIGYRRCDDPAEAVAEALAALAAGEARLIRFVVDRAASLALRRAPG
ncbi:MAG: 2-succinyl-5-enolpyruvyl-6-hydroxy-3-cyclohexene-1-carboxylic-acid synthase, partial [Azospira sp.]|nr:2-succinyl-5-enolpyruvyl-6-hydroxy-3-cyclohexene-1-carboxylic-acid synthase [Azospira sp.]